MQFKQNNNNNKFVNLSWSSWNLKIWVTDLNQCLVMIVVTRFELKKFKPLFGMNFFENEIWVWKCKPVFVYIFFEVRFELKKSKSLLVYKSKSQFIVTTWFMFDF